jgi:hypothetical protein
MISGVYRPVCMGTRSPNARPGGRRAGPHAPEYVWSVAHPSNENQEDPFPFACTFEYRSEPTWHAGR